MNKQEEIFQALSDIEMAVGALGITELVESWGDPRHRPELGVTLRTNCEAVYHLYDAYVTANRIVNNREARGSGDGA